MRGTSEQGVGSSVQKFNKLAALGAMTATLMLAGCRQDMQDQPKFFPQRGTDFYADGRSVRPQVENTVARNQLHEDGYFYTGLVNGKEGDGMPFPATLEVLQRDLPRDPVSALALGGAALCSMRLMLDAAGIASHGIAGVVAVKLTAAAYLAAAHTWSRDESPDLAPTMATLDRRLRGIERWLVPLHSTSRNAVEADA